MEIGKPTLKEVMSSRGYTAEDIAYETGIPTITIKQYMCRRREPKLYNALVIAECLRVKVDMINWRKVVI